MMILAFARKSFRSASPAVRAQDAMPCTGLGAATPLLPFFAAGARGYRVSGRNAAIDAFRPAAPWFTPLCADYA